MKSAFLIEKTIFDMLVEAQKLAPDNPYPFSVSPTLTLHNYNPGDMRVVPFVPEDGVYIFFKDSDFEPSMRAPGVQEHDPVLCIYVYMSRGATSEQSSPQAAHSGAKAAVDSIYGAIMHAEFKRLLRELVDATEPGLRPTKTAINKVTNVLTYPITEQGTRTVSFWEMLGGWHNTETTGTNPGRPITGLVDRLRAVREEGDIDGDTQL